MDYYIRLSQLRVKWLHYHASANIIPDTNVCTSGHTKAVIDGNHNWCL